MTPKQKKPKVIKVSASKAMAQAIAYKRNQKTKFGKRFNMGGSGLTNASESFQ